MARLRSATWLDGLLALLILAAALGVRAWYLIEYVGSRPANAVWQVQGSPPTANPDLNPTRDSDEDLLVKSLREKGIVDGFAAPAPFAKATELSAALAPGYPVFRYLMEAYFPPAVLDSLAAVRWMQAVLGSLTAMLYFLIARRAFSSRLVGLLAGLLATVYPYWVINVGELADGTLATFLLAWTLWLGMRAGHHGGAFSSLLFGLGLAGLVLTRAALVPLAIVMLLWFFRRCRHLQQGWLCSLVAFFGMVMGVSPWIVQTYQMLGKPVPVVTTAWWHLWVGNNPQATGGPYSWGMDATLGQERRDQLAAASQADRYEMLAPAVRDSVVDHPGETLRRRFTAARYFCFGDRRPDQGSLMVRPSDSPAAESWLLDVMQIGLLAMFGLAVLGWRWSYGWRWTSAPLVLPVFWLPLPYILAHAERLHGPRLPLDGPLLCLAALAFASLIPYLGGKLLRGEKRRLPAEPSATN
jgi:4-amino-4-deoxy-L-arabinose transferase-like glycosyltransferase